MSIEYDHSKSLTIVPAKPDAELAAELKKEIVDRLTELGAAMDKANASGFEVAFQLSRQPWSNKNIIASLILAKHY